MISCVREPHFDGPQRDKAFTSLKERLATTPMLAYPAFNVDFTLETDASIEGLGAVSSQPQADGKLHPVAYASRALNKAETSYSITELETLAVAWAVSHFHPTCMAIRLPFSLTIQL